MSGYYKPLTGDYINGYSISCIWHSFLMSGYYKPLTGDYINGYSIWHSFLMSGYYKPLTILCSIIQEIKR